MAKRKVTYEQLRKLLLKRNESQSWRILSALCSPRISDVHLRKFAIDANELTGPRIKIVAEMLGVTVEIPKGKK